MTREHDDLRRKAESLADKRPEVGDPSDSDELHNVLHELVVYQGELELQNEELRSAQHQMLDAQDRYRSLFQDAPIGYVTLAPDGTVSQANEVARSMIFGMHWIPCQKPMSDYIAVRDRDRFGAFLKRISEQSTLLCEDFRAVRPDAAGLLDVRIDGISLHDAGEAVFEIRLALTDITELKHAQRDLKELSLSLERRVEHQMADSHKKEQQLHALVEELNEAEQRERRRIAGELHDYLAQLLVAARLRTANIRLSLGGSEQSSSLQSVEDLLRDGLIYTRTLIAEISPAILFESGLSPALRHLAKMMREHKLIVDASGVEDVESCETTAIMLYQCIRELLFNTLKHSGTDKAFVTLRRRNGRVQATVRDEGRGAELEEIERAEPLREKFGLFNITERVEAIKGEFSIETSPGHGMTCTIEVPANPDTERDREPDQQPPLPAAKAPDAIKVLVVDDHTALRQGLVRYFADLHDVSVAGEAGSGKDAIAKAAKLEPDAVIMDINLPDMSGVEVTRRIKAESPRIAVVGLSMRDDAAIVSEMRAAGAAIHLGKDAPIEQIVCQIRKACGRATSDAV